MDNRQDRYVSNTIEKYLKNIHLSIFIFLTKILRYTFYFIFKQLYNCRMK